MKAKFAGSMPTVSGHGSLLLWPVFWSSDRLKIASAAHQRLESQLLPGGHCTHPGG
jgi:hypothetical protein